jgi:O-antigen ligase
MFAGVIVLVIAGIALTQSRGGAVTLALILFCLFLRRPSIKVFSVGIVFVSVGLLFVPADYWERLQSLSTIGEDSEYGSIEVRYRFIEAGIETFLRHPVLGVGMGNYGRALVFYDLGFGNWYYVAHNMYLEFFVENGAIAGLLFLSLLAAAVLQSIRYDTYNRLERSAYGLGFCFSMSLLSVMISGLFLSQGKNSVLWFFVGIGLAFSGMIRSSTATQDAQSPEIINNHFARLDNPRRRNHE